jgi:hypothetical protein
MDEHQLNDIVVAMMTTNAERHSKGLEPVSVNEYLFSQFELALDELINELDTIPVDER